MRKFRGKITGISMSRELFEKLERARGQINRSKFVTLALEQYLKKMSEEK